MDFKASVVQNLGKRGPMRGPDSQKMEIREFQFSSWNLVSMVGKISEFLFWDDFSILEMLDFLDLVFVTIPLLRKCEIF